MRNRDRVRSTGQRGFRLSIEFMEASVSISDVGCMAPDDSMGPGCTFTLNAQVGDNGRSVSLPEMTLTLNPASANNGQDTELILLGPLGVDVNLSPDLRDCIIRRVQGAIFEQHIQASCSTKKSDQAGFGVLLTHAGSNKLHVIKEIRLATSLTLKESKDLADSAPAIVMTEVDKHRAEEMAQRLDLAGATAQVIRCSSAH